jgi:hypothetical protein
VGGCAVALNRIAEAYVELRAQGEGRVKAALGSVRKQLKGMKSDGGGALGALEKVQSTLGKLLIPVAVVGSVAAIVRQFKDAAKAAEEWEKNLRGVVKAAQDAAIAARQQTQDIADIDRQRAEGLERFNKAQEEIKKSIADVDTQNLLDEVVTGIQSAFFDAPITATERVAVAEKQLARLSQAFREERRALDLVERDILEKNREQARIEEESIRRQTELLNAQRLGGANARALVSLGQEYDDILERIQKAESDGVREALQDRLRLISTLGEETEKAIRDEQAARKAAIKAEELAKIESVRRIAQETAAANQQAINETAQAQIDAARSIAASVGVLNDIKGLLASVLSEAGSLRRL